MALVIFLISVGLAGWISADALREVSESSPAERISTAILLAISIALAISWSLALTGRLEATWLLVAAIAVAGAALLVRFFRRPDRRDGTGDDDEPDTAEAASPLRLVAPVLLVLVTVSWSAFLLWKGWVAPPHSHDAAVYHMPRAALLANAGEFQRFDFSDRRIDSLPANYELLLADILLLEGSDRIVEWFSVLIFGACLILAAALSRRWWGIGAHAVLVPLALFTIPLFLLHGAAIKNDLLVTFLITSALYWAGRWIERPSATSLVLTITAACAAAGTKPQGLIVGASIALTWALATIIRKRALGATARSAAIALAATLILFPLLGGVHYLPEAEEGADRSTLDVASYSSDYGQWRYLWQAPVMIWVAPFSGSDQAVRPPWGGRNWFWPRYDVHDSNWGYVVSLLALLLPLTLWKSREILPERSLERLLISGAVVVTAIVILPSQSWISGYISAYPRYLMFAPLFVILFTIPPLRLLTNPGRDRHLVSALIALALAAVFFSISTDVAVKDRYGPLRDIRWAAANPGARFTPMMADRATVVVDQIAGPDDSIDVYGGNDSWIYPAMGRERQRDLHFVDGPDELRPDSDWVIVDQLVHVVWGDITDIREWQTWLHRNPPRPEDLEFIERLSSDPRFETVYVNERMAQAVFHRRSVTTSP